MFQFAIGFMVFEVAAAALNPTMFALESAPEAAAAETSENDSLQRTKWETRSDLFPYLVSTRASEFRLT